MVQGVDFAPDLVHTKQVNQTRPMRKIERLMNAAITKGVDFKLEPAQPVLAAGGGEVVYAGNGLGGFRHLVIVKHDQRFLSAYSLNRAITVQEGQRLDSGAIIAAADPSGAASTLRFEIRKDGQPVDPVSVIGR